MILVNLICKKIMIDINGYMDQMIVIEEDEKKERLWKVN